MKLNKIVFNCNWLNLVECKMLQNLFLKIVIFGSSSSNNILVWCKLIQIYHSCTGGQRHLLLDLVTILVQVTYPQEAQQL